MRSAGRLIHVFMVLQLISSPLLTVYFYLQMESARKEDNGRWFQMPKHQLSHSHRLPLNRVSIPIRVPYKLACLHNRALRKVKVHNLST